LKTSYSFLIIFAAVLLVFFASSQAAFAQPPDAGTLLQEERQLRPHLPDRLPDMDKPELLMPPDPDPGVKILVKEFRFTGRYDQLATEGELQELVRNWVGKEVTFAELQYLAQVVTVYLRDTRGYLLARAYLPRQDVTEGIIEIAVVPGHLDSSAVINIKEPSRVRTSVLQGIADRAVPEDSPARMDRLERAVLLMNDLPGVEARASLEPGQDPGSTSLIINASEGRLLQGTISADNHGSRYTGRAKGTVRGSAYNTTGFGDQVSLSYTKAERLNQYHGAFSLPLGSSGLTGTLSWTGLDYELGKDLSGLDVKGLASTYSADVSYPLVRSRKSSIWAGLGGEYTYLRDEALGSRTRVRGVSTANVNLSGSFFDGFAGGGLSSADLVLTSGEVDLSGFKLNKQVDSLTARTQGSFVRLAYSLARLQRMSANTSLFVSARGQFADSNLDSSQKFILGGPSGIRSYPGGEASGDEGHAFTVEGRYDLPFSPSWARTQIVGFYDAGWIRLHHNKWTGSITNATGSNEYWISGAGIGLSIINAGLYSFRAAYAHKVDTNPGRTQDGKDGDNTGDKGRLWAQLMVWF
jgi:hemolysin activation/secretion protein